jgi:hypothetical protein
MNIDRQMVKEFVNFVLPGCGEWTIACKQNHDNSQQVPIAEKGLPGDGALKRLIKMRRTTL